MGSLEDIPASRNVTINGRPTLMSPARSTVHVPWRPRLRVGVEITVELDEGDEETNVTWRWGKNSGRLPTLVLKSPARPVTLIRRSKRTWAPTFVPWSRRGTTTHLVHRQDTSHS